MLILMSLLCFQISILSSTWQAIEWTFGVGGGNSAIVCVDAFSVTIFGACASLRSYKSGKMGQNVVITIHFNVGVTSFRAYLLSQRI